MEDLSTVSSLASYDSSVPVNTLLMPHSSPFSVINRHPKQMRSEPGICKEKVKVPNAPYSSAIIAYHRFYIFYGCYIPEWKSAMPALQQANCSLVPFPSNNKLGHPHNNRQGQCNGTMKQQIIETFTYICTHHRPMGRKTLLSPTPTSVPDSLVSHLHTM